MDFFKERRREFNARKARERKSILDNIQHDRIDYAQEKLQIAQKLNENRKPFRKFDSYVPLQNLIDIQTQIWFDEPDSSD